MFQVSKCNCVAVKNVRGKFANYFTTMSQNDTIHIIYDLIFAQLVDLQLRALKTVNSEQRLQYTNNSVA